MNSSNVGGSISVVEVTNISPHGLWLFVEGREYLLPFEKFPWFTDARLRDILDVQLLHGFHLHWPRLDIDLELASLDDPEKFPLVYSAG
jgi:hypothetical protein